MGNSLSKIKRDQTDAETSFSNTNGDTLFNDRKLRNSKKVTCDCRARRRLFQENHVTTCYERWMRHIRRMFRFLLRLLRKRQTPPSSPVSFSKL